MNFVLVGITFVVLATTVVGCAVLGTDRLVPGRKALEFLASDGVAAPGKEEMPLIFSERPQGKELQRVRFATSLAGYNKDEVDEAFALLAAEIDRLRAQLHTDSTAVGTEMPLPEVR